MRRALIFGYPIGHSISPAIHNAAFRARGLEARYEARAVPPEQLAAAVEELRESSVVGANITVPHKEAVLSLVDEVDEVVRAIGAANTIVNRQGLLWATNTDASGFARSLVEAGIVAERHQVLLLGAGGSARAVTEALLSAGVTTLLIANRHVARAARIVDDFGPRYPRSRLLPLSLDQLQSVDLRACGLVVNTTTLGLHGDASPLAAELLPTSGAVVDIIYNPARTRLLQDAERLGLRTLNGLPMLVHQAAAAWEIWMGQPAPVDEMFAAARTALQPSH